MAAMLERAPSPRPYVVNEERKARTAELLAEAWQLEEGLRKRQLRAEVVVINIDFAHAVAGRFARRGIDSDDLEQVACEGLLKAVQRFDPTRGCELLAFALPTIRGELQRHFRDLGWMVRPTRQVQETQWRVARVEEDLTARLARSPSDNEVAAEVGITSAQYAEARGARGCFHPTSLDHPAFADEHGASLGDQVADEDRDLPACEARLIVLPAVRKLTDRDRQVLYLRYFEELPQREIGERVGVGQAQVSRILDHVLSDLRERLLASAPGGADVPPAA